LDFNYKIEEGKTYFYLFGRTDQKERIAVKIEHTPFFYAQIQDIDKETLTSRLKNLSLEAKPEPARVLQWEEGEKELLGKKIKLWKVFVNFPKAVPLISKELQGWGIECYEKDILFVHRTLRDLGVIPGTLVEAEGELKKESHLRVPLFEAKKLKQVSLENYSGFRTLAIDIETYAKEKILDMDKNPILMLAFYGVDEKGESFRKVITWKNFSHKLNYLEVVSDEVELLKRFKQIFLDFQPDILTGYFSDGFDLPYLKHRANKYKVKLDLGLDYSDLETGSKADFREGESKITGIMHLDVCKFVRYIFGTNLKTDSYTLDAVAEELIGHKKHVVNLDNLAQVWDDGLDQLNDYCEYNLHDAHLTLQLCQKLLYDMLEFTKIVGLPTNDVIRMRFSRLVENYILKRAVEYKVLAPNKPIHEEVDQRLEETYQGAFVYEPIPGLYKDLVVFDFRSLYPSIIISHNVGPESFHCTCCGKNKEARVPTQEEYWFCVREKKFIPMVLEQLVSIRADLKKQIKEARAKKENTVMLEARSWAIKTLANSFYGYLGFFGARWYCIECARSTTAYARNYILTTIAKAEESGFKVIYSDTDSLFCLLGEQGIEKALGFQKEINAHLPGSMELELEGYYPRGIFVAARGSEKGAKKRYALISKEGKMKITGFEIVRSNASPLSKEVQEGVLRLVLEDKIPEALKFAQEKIQLLKSGKMPLNKLIIKTQITKELNEYSSIAPHVAVGWKLVEKGERVGPGSVVEYIICRGSGLVRDRAKIPVDARDYDADYYLNNQLLPAVVSIFAVLGYNENDLTGAAAQTGLGKFF
jgi:DNA polymerase elongation subunit (family B)